MTWFTADRAEGDEDEPDLHLYGSLDMAALVDVRKVGENYVRGYQAVLHETPGLRPGYLPEADSVKMLSGAIHLLELGCVLEERAASLKKEALGRVQVALAGSPPNCLYAMLESFFGLKEAPKGVEGGSTIASDPPAPGSSTLPHVPTAPNFLPPHLRPVVSQVIQTPVPRALQSLVMPWDSSRAPTLIIGRTQVWHLSTYQKLTRVEWSITALFLIVIRRGWPKRIPWPHTSAATI